MWLPAVLLIFAGLGWWWSVVGAAGIHAGAMSMPMGARPTVPLAAFLIAWVAMTAAMMLPGVMPVVRRYVHAAARRTSSHLRRRIPGGLERGGRPRLSGFEPPEPDGAYMLVGRPFRRGGGGARWAASALTAEGDVYAALPLADVLIRRTRSAP